MYKSMTTKLYTQMDPSTYQNRVDRLQEYYILYYKCFLHIYSHRYYSVGLK